MKTKPIVGQTLFWRAKYDEYAEHGGRQQSQPGEVRVMKVGIKYFFAAPAEFADSEWCWPKYNLSDWYDSDSYGSRRLFLTAADSDAWHQEDKDAAEAKLPLVRVQSFFNAYREKPLPLEFLKTVVALLPKDS